MAVFARKSNCIILAKREYIKKDLIMFNKASEFVSSWRLKKY
jgi:hypothetical protein